MAEAVVVEGVVVVVVMVMVMVMIQIHSMVS
jgi:hypothetical protein